jgi:predicted transcriptional regulator of viral defense system
MKRKEGYSIHDVIEITGFHPKRISNIVKAGKIKRIKQGVYDIESVDAFQKDIEERKKIDPANWIPRGNLT